MFSFTHIKQDLHVSFKLSALQILKWTCSVPKSSLDFWVIAMDFHPFFSCAKIQKEVEYTHWCLWDPLYTTDKKKETEQSANMKFMKSPGLACYECMGAWNKLHDHLSGLRWGSLTACLCGGEVGRWKVGMTGGLPKGERTSFCSGNIAL